MKTNNKQKDTREKYEEVMNLVEKAKKIAQEFIKANKHIDPQLRLKYS